MRVKRDVLPAGFVTSNLFSDLGASARLGRLLDASLESQTVAVHSSQFWESHFGADPQVVGKTIRLNGKLVTVMGVAGRDFTGLSMESPDLWMPMLQHPAIVSGSKLLTDFGGQVGGVQMFGRLQSGAHREDRRRRSALARRRAAQAGSQEYLGKREAAQRARRLRPEPRGHAAGALGAAAIATTRLR